MLSPEFSLATFHLPSCRVTRSLRSTLPYFCRLITPLTARRGRFSLEFFQDSLRLVGKSTDYRVPFTSIHRIFLLPKVDDLHVQLVLGLDPPIRQGATRYPFLVAQWPKDEEVDAELNLSE